MAFFTSWQTWVKLTFVLACAMFIVLAYSVGVRYSNKRKLQKHSNCIATEIAERGEMNEAVRPSEGVPFGIRAIERGCMVEGVWNSKTTTPLQTPPSSKANSPILKARNNLKKHKRDSSLSNVSHVDILEPTLVTPNSKKPGSRVPNIAPENIGIIRQNQVAPGILDLDLEISERYLHSDGPGPALYNNQPISATTCGRPPPKYGLQAGPSWVSSADQSSEHLHPDDSASQISTTHRDVSGWTTRLSLTRCSSADPGMQPPLSQPQMPPLSRGMETLKYMNAHRCSHAAETGQLIPRVRRKPSSGDCSTGFGTSISDTGKEQSSFRSVSWPVSNCDFHENSTLLTNPSLPPNLADIPIGILAKQLPLPPLRHAGLDNENHSKLVRVHRRSLQSEHASLIEDRPGRLPSPSSLCMKSRVARSKPCPSSWTDRVQEQLEEVQRNQEKSVKFPPADVVLSHHNKTARKINSGFEILPSGTLAMPTPAKVWGDAAGTLVDTSNEAPVQRKLQKRDRSRSRSRRSSSEEARSTAGKKIDNEAN